MAINCGLWELKTLLSSKENTLINCLEWRFENGQIAARPLLWKILRVRFFGLLLWRASSAESLSLFYRVNLSKKSFNSTLQSLVGRPLTWVWSKSFTFKLQSMKRKKREAWNVKKMNVSFNSHPFDLESIRALFVLLVSCRVCVITREMDLRWPIGVKSTHTADFCWFMKRKSV